MADDRRTEKLKKRQSIPEWVRVVNQVIAEELARLKAMAAAKEPKDEE